MKYLTRLLAAGLFAVAIVASSCTDLSETPYSEVTADNYQPTADDIVSVVAPVYTPLRFGVMGFHTWLSAQHEAADNIVTPTRPNGWFDGGRFNRMHRHTWTATDGTPNSVWGMCFDGINAANRVLLQIERGEIPIEDGREELIAELKVARILLLHPAGFPRERADCYGLQHNGTAPAEYPAGGVRFRCQ